MKTVFKILILFYLTLVCQAGLVRELIVWEMQPSFLALLLVGFTTIWSGNKSLFLAACVGLADDALRGEAFGIGMFFAVLGVSLSQWNLEEKKSEFSFGRALFLLSWYLLGVNLTVMLLDGKLEWWQSVLMQSGGAILYTSLILLIFILLKRLVNRFWSGSKSQVAWR